MKIGKFPKNNRVFTQELKVLEFIEYCKNKYSQNIRDIKLTLYDEDDAEGNEWQLNISECSKNNKQGTMWAPWFIPTIVKPIRTPFKNKRYKLCKENIKN